MEKFNVERVFSEVVSGRTPVNLGGRSCFFRHLTPCGRGNSSYYYEDVIGDCKRRGILSLSERLQELEKSGQWTADQEAEYARQQEFIHSLNDTLKTQFLPSQIESMKAQIADAEKKMKELRAARHTAVGVTAEQFADKKANEKFIFDNLCADSECSKLLFSENEYEELEDSEITNIINTINGIVNNYSESYLKKAGLSRLVQDLISISDGDAMRFYGVPAIKLTYYQIELLNYGKWFKHILSDPKKKPPAHMLDNPDMLIEWSTGQANASNVLNSPGQNVAVVGATDADIKAIGGENAVSMDGLIKKKGKMRGAEFAKALGYK